MRKLSWLYYFGILATSPLAVFSARQPHHSPYGSFHAWGAVYGLFLAAELIDSLAHHQEIKASLAATLYGLGCLWAVLIGVEAPHLFFATAAWFTWAVLTAAAWWSIQALKRGLDAWSLVVDVEADGRPADDLLVEAFPRF